MKLNKLLSPFILCLALSGMVNSVQGQAKPYLFGVFPYLTPLRMDDIYAPVSQQLSVKLGHGVRFRTSSSIPRFRGRLMSKYYDIALIQPVLYPLAVDKLGYIPLVRVEEQLFSVIMVLDNGPVKSMDDLVGTTIGTPPVMGPVFALAKRALAEHGLSPDKKNIRFDKNKTIAACFQKLLVGHTSACISPDFAVKPYERSMGVKFRTLLRSESVPSQALVVHPRVPRSERSRITEAFLSLGDTAAGQELLQSLNTRGFVEVNDGEYDILRSFVRELNN